MFKFSILSLISLILMAAQSFAGTDGHGGNAIVCMNPGGGNTFELLDYFEARLTTDFQVDLGPETPDYLARVKYVLDRYAKIDPVAAARYWERAQNFEKEMRRLTPEEMKKLNDSNEEVNPPKGCDKEQFAVQVFNLKPHQVRYLVNKDLWKAADSETRAGLVLHEIELPEAIEHYGQTNTDNMRYFNAEISSSQMANYTLEDYLNLLNVSGLRFKDQKDYCDDFSIPNPLQPDVFKNVTFSACSYFYKKLIQTPDPRVLSFLGFVIGGTIEFGDHQVAHLDDQDRFYCDIDPDSSDNSSCLFRLGAGQISSGVIHQRGLKFYASSELTIFSNGVFSGAEVEMNSPGSTSIGGKTIVPSKFTYVQFYRSGAVRELTTDTIFVGPQGIRVNGMLDFFEGGAMQSAMITKPAPISIQGVTVKVSNSIKFYENGQLKSGTIQGGVKLKDTDGNEINFKNGLLSSNWYNVDFDDRGRVINLKN